MIGSAHTVRSSLPARTCLRSRREVILTINCAPAPEPPAGTQAASGRCRPASLFLRIRAPRVRAACTASVCPAHRPVGGGEVVPCGQGLGRSGLSARSKAARPYSNSGTASAVRPAVPRFSEQSVGGTLKEVRAAQCLLLLQVGSAGCASELPGQSVYLEQETVRRSMVRRRSTVRFRNGAPAQRTNSNSSNGPRGPFRGPSSSHIEPRGASVCLRFAELCGLGGSLMDLLGCAEDHRRGALD